MTVGWHMPEARSVALQLHQRCGQAHRAFERGATHEAGLPFGRAADGALDQLGLRSPRAPHGVAPLAMHFDSSAHSP